MAEGEESDLLHVGCETERSAYFLKRPANPIGVAPTIENAKNHSFSRGHTVINRKRKTPRQKPMKSETNAVDSGVEHKRIDLRKYAVEEIITNSGCARVVKLTAARDIFEGWPENSNSHSKRFRNSFFASSQSNISIRPAAKSASVFRNSASCHAGL